MRVGQPCVEWKHRHLDGKADEHAGEDPDLNRTTKQTAVLSKIGNVEACFACGHLARHLEVERQEGNEHQRRTEHRVQEELERGVLTIFATPDTDHEVHRQEHEFEEHKEQDEVLRHKGAGHANLQHEHQDEERLGVTRRRDVVPRVDHHQHGDDHAQDVQRQAQAVEADGVVAVNHLDPRRVSKELQLAGTAVVELGQRVDADKQRRHRREQSDLLV